jgi:3-oxoacyl-[acyl-carrier protein] reductase
MSDQPADPAPKLLRNKVAVITGANRGIGRAILELFARHGASVIACARQSTPELFQQYEVIAAREQVQIWPVFFDFANADNVKEAVRGILADHKRIDVLVNNAGTASGALFQMTSAQELRRVFEINFFSQISFSQGISRLMVRAKSGAIVNIASTAALNGDPGMLSYGSSKAALLLATRVMSAELAAANIRVNAIAPNVTKTDMYDQMETKAREKLIQSSALKRAAEPLEVANAALFLASDQSSYVTGQVLTLDGGRG